MSEDTSNCWRERALELVQERAERPTHVNFRNWCKKELSGWVTRTINEIYWEALLSESGKAEVADVLKLMGRHHSHANRAGGQKSDASEVKMEYYFPFAVANDCEVRGFAPKTFSVREETFLICAARIRQWIDNKKRQPKPPTFAELRLITELGSELIDEREVLLATDGADPERLRDAIEPFFAIHDYNLRYPELQLTVDRVAVLVTQWALPVYGFLLSSDAPLIVSLFDDFLVQ